MSQSCQLETTGNYLHGFCSERTQQQISESQPLGWDTVTGPTKLTLQRCLHFNAILFDIKEGDEVIIPSYTFVSTANAFVLRGAKIVFVDIRPDSLNIDETKIEQAITKKQKP